MKPSPLLCIWFIVILSLFSGPAWSQEDDALVPPEDSVVQELDARYRELLAEQVNATFETPLQKLSHQYVSLLEAEKEKAETDGDLEAAIAWATELARVTGAEAPDRAASATPSRLEQLRTVYETEAEPLRKGRQEKLEELNAFYLNALENREKELTVAGAVDLAVRVREWRDRHVLPTPEPEEEEPATTDTTAGTNMVPKSLSGNEIDQGEPGAVYTLRLPQGFEMKFSWCPPGSFTMGSPLDEAGRETEHALEIMDESQRDVEIEAGFWIAQTEVTQAVWTAFMGNTVKDQHERLPPSATQGWFQMGEVGPDIPMYFVNYADADEFIREVNRELNLHGWLADLPLEEQWEYACRAGTTTPFVGPDLDALGWYRGNSGLKAQPVATREPNAWGIYDMHGNMRELAGRSRSSIVARGGSFVYGAPLCRSAMRFKIEDDLRVRTLGFRIVLEQE